MQEEANAADIGADLDEFMKAWTKKIAGEELDAGEDTALLQQQPDTALGQRVSDTARTRVSTQRQADASSAPPAAAAPAATTRGRPRCSLLRRPRAVFSFQGLAVLLLLSAVVGWCLRDAPDEAAEERITGMGPEPWGLIGSGDATSTSDGDDPAQGPIVLADWNATKLEGMVREELIPVIHLDEDVEEDTDQLLPPPTDGGALSSWPTYAPTNRPKCNSPAASDNMKLKSRASALLTPLGLQPWSVVIDHGGHVRSETRCLRHLAAFEAARGQKIPFPVVVKPVAGRQGAGVVTGVKTVEGICAALRTMRGTGGNVGAFRKRAKKKKKKVPLALVEEMVFGANYRVFVFRGRVIDVVFREMAFVVGNGKATLGKLIRRRNKAQKKARLFETKAVSWNMIAARYNLTRKSVVPTGDRVQITMVGNYHNGPSIVYYCRLHSFKLGLDPHCCAVLRDPLAGCNPFHVPLDAIHPSNLRKWAAVNDALGGAMSGMDYMTPDINGTKGYVIDVNNMADDVIHLKASFGPEPEKHVWLPFSGAGRLWKKKRDLWHELIPCYYWGDKRSAGHRWTQRFCKCLYHYNGAQHLRPRGYKEGG